MGPVGKILGEGSGRTVYALTTTEVLKLAYNAAGVAQNRTETRLYRRHPDLRRILAPVLCHAQDHEWIVMRRATPVRRNFDLQNLEADAQDLIDHLVDVCHLEIGDVAKPSSWGRVDGLHVLIDYGLTSRVYRRYYVKSPTPRFKPPASDCP